MRLRVSSITIKTAYEAVYRTIQLYAPASKNVEKVLPFRNNVNRNQGFSLNH